MATKRYQIWDKTSNVFTPSGEKFTPEQWIERYPIFEEDFAIPVIAKGTYNGGYCGELGQLKQIYGDAGVEFTDEMTNEEVLEAIEAYEDKMNAPSDEPSAETRIADALEYQNLMAE